MFTRVQYSRRIALGAALIITSATTVVAQTGVADTKWEPWIGCWRVTRDGQLNLAPTGPLVCVTPTGISSAVQIATIDSGKVVARDTVNADGADRQIAKGGCTGSQRAHFSSDAKRVYLRSELACGTGLKRSGTGMLSISPEGDWLDVESMHVAASSTVSATRFHAAKVAASEVPADIATATTGRELAISAARAAAGEPLSSASVVDAVKQVDTAVVQTWIVQRGRKFNFDAQTLVALADAGVPGSVTDVLIGVSYPEHFALQEQSASAMAGGPLTPLDSARLASQYLSSRCYGFDPYWSSSSLFDPCASRFGLSYLYSPYRYGSYGYNPYGYGYTPGYVGYVPVVVVKGDNPHGRVVNGHGYTRSGDGFATSGSASPGTSGSSASAGGGSAASSSGSSSSGSASSGGGRTAHGRP